MHNFNALISLFPVLRMLLQALQRWALLKDRHSRYLCYSVFAAWRCAAMGTGHEHHVAVQHSMSQIVMRALRYWKFHTFEHMRELERKVNIIADRLRCRQSLRIWMAYLAEQHEERAKQQTWQKIHGWLGEFKSKGPQEDGVTKVHSDADDDFMRDLQLAPKAFSFLGDQTIQEHGSAHL